ncbi:alpha/beta fold hydrolase [Gordonia phthalatica]|uniref:AB hydrolase-1 domain-containing protein n=1 Tax=Gordonia phthalatica TaxID=1136941 RepID=A0A0N9MQU6_9ACTN|nr:alpha/beta hydrolase [Gordonia phthalatica]ALG84762.1 hypothetical protein ACH46_09970 [Gordonia phthalatica]
MDQIAADDPGPIVLVGHSIGGMLSILTAATTNADLAGVEVSGLGELWQPGLREMWGSMIGDATEIDLPADAHAGVMLGPEETQRSDSVVRDGELLRPIPMPELRDVVAWSDRLPAAAAAVTVPVSLTLAEFDKIWQNDAAAQDALARHFTASPTVQVQRFLNAGHSIELHANAAEYVRTQLDFVDRVYAV